MEEKFIEIKAEKVDIAVAMARLSNADIDKFIN